MGEILGDSCVKTGDIRGQLCIFTELTADRMRRWTVGADCGGVRAGVHAPKKSVSVPASISLLPPVQTRSGVHTYRRNPYRLLYGGQFRE